MSTPSETDVVIALATPWGRSALAVVRLSGEGTRDVISKICRPQQGSDLSVGRQRRVDVFDERGVFDDGVIVMGRAPNTFTGEETAEITVHGNPVIVQRLLDAAVNAGARLATRGEFTRRALSNGKVDLLQAEAIYQVIHATSDAGLAVGRQAMDGRLQAALDPLRMPLVVAAAELEALLDYPGDELAYMGEDALLESLRGASRQARHLAQTYAAGRRAVEGARVALVGAVNAGKSSLFNSLVGRKRALVHDIEGTTRDVLEVVTPIEGLQITLLDTAGERETDDPIEAAGLALARELLEEVDLLLVVLRARAEGLTEVEEEILRRTAGRPRVVVYNGVDREGVQPAPTEAISTSAKADLGIDTLRKAIAEALQGQETLSGQVAIASARQRDLLLAVADCVDEAIEALPWAGVAVSADAVTRALEEIDSLTGEETRERILDEMFSRFCIGK